MKLFCKIFLSILTALCVFKGLQLLIDFLYDKYGKRFLLYEASHLPRKGRGEGGRGSHRRGAGEGRQGDLLRQKYAGGQEKRLAPRGAGCH